MNDDDLRAAAARQAAEIVTDLEHRGPHCGTRYAVDLPGLMMGQAGIGHGLLRLAEPGRVPSVLTLAT